MTEIQKFRAQCDPCSGETLHDVLFEKAFTGSESIDDEFSIDWGVTWRVIQCRGCETVSVRRDSWNSEACDNETGALDIDLTYFPPRTFREEPTWFRDSDFIASCPFEVHQLHKELYICLQNDCPAAAAMIMRAMFGHMMISAVHDSGSFKGNLDAFEASGYVSKKQREVIDPLLEAGHASIHRGFIPRKKDILTLVDILEGLMEILYVHSPKATELGKRIPKRRKP